MDDSDFYVRRAQIWADMKFHPGQELIEHLWRRERARLLDELNEIDPDDEIAGLAWQNEWDYFYKNGWKPWNG